MKKLALPTLVAGVFCAGLPAVAQEKWSEVKLTGGAEYTTGSYGSVEDTEITYVPVSVTWESGKFRFGATAAWIDITGPGGVVGGDGGTVIGPGSGTVTSENGLGDVILTGALLLYPDAPSNGPYFELVGKVKLPTADEQKFLGTGETDYSLQLDVFHALGKFTPFATLGYKLRGDPAGFDLNDGLFATAGAVFEASEDFSFGAAYDWKEASIDASDDVSEVAPFVTFDLTTSVSLTAYGVFGTSNASPDSGGGIQLSKTF